MTFYVGWAVAWAVFNLAKKVWTEEEGTEEKGTQDDVKAAPDSWFLHLAIEVPGENTSTEWLEKVSDEDYNKIKQNRKQRRIP